MAACHGVFEHFFHFVDAFIDLEFFGIANVLFVLSLPHLGMFDHIIDFSGEVLRICGPIKIAFVACKIFCCRFFTVCNDGDKSAGDCLHTGDRFDFRIGAMNVEIAKVYRTDEFFLFQERNNGRIRQFAAEF